MVMTPKGPGDARTAAASNATPSCLSVVSKQVLTVSIDFREDQSSEFGDVVNGTKDPVHTGEALRSKVRGGTPSRDPKRRPSATFARCLQAFSPSLRVPPGRQRTSCSSRRCATLATVSGVGRNVHLNFFPGLRGMGVAGDRRREGAGEFSRATSWSLFNAGS